MTTARYILGYALSVALTAGSFGLVWAHQLTHHRFPTHQGIFIGVIAFAVLQLLVQLAFFLHLGRQSKARDVLALCFAAIIVFFIVAGTLWIMTHLSHNMIMETPFDGAPAPEHQHGGL